MRGRLSAFALPAALVAGHAAVGRSDYEWCEGRRRRDGESGDRACRAACPGPVTSAGATRSRPRPNLSGRIGFFTAKRRRALSVRGAAVSGRASGRQKRGCGQCPHLGLRLGPYNGRTGPDCAGFPRSQCLQGLESGSSPTSGTCFPRSEALLLSYCGQPAQFCGPGAVLGAGLGFSTTRVPPFSREARLGLSYYFMGERRRRYMTGVRVFIRSSSSQSSSGGAATES